MSEQATNWDKLLLRLKTCAYKECRGHGLAVVSVKLVLRDGELRGWTRPVPTYTEPGRRGGLELEDALLTDEALEAVVAT